MTVEVKRTLLMVDDDPEDILLVKTAVRRAGLPLEVVSLYDGDALFNFLDSYHFKQTDDSGAPSVIIFLDLNMPRLDGRKCLQQIKANPAWADLPILIFSTSEAPDDIRSCYELSANSYICKPDDPKSLDKILITVYRYWFGDERSDV